MLLKVFATAGTKVTVQDIRISKGYREKVTYDHQYHHNC